MPEGALLADMLFWGSHTVPVDHKRAFALASAGAGMGCSHSMGVLGCCYAFGRGVPEDDVEAYMWANLASAQGDEASKLLKDELTERMTREQIAEGQKMSREWLEKRENK
jgi:TPR repeat protein